MTNPINEVSKSDFETADRLAVESRGRLKSCVDLRDAIAAALSHQREQIMAEAEKVKESILDCKEWRKSGGACCQCVEHFFQFKSSLEGGSK